MRSLRSPHLLVVVAGYALGALALYSGLAPRDPSFLERSRSRRCLVGRSDDGISVADGGRRD